MLTSPISPLLIMSTCACMDGGGGYVGGCGLGFDFAFAVGESCCCGMVVNTLVLVVKYMECSLVS